MSRRPLLLHRTIFAVVVASCNDPSAGDRAETATTSSSGSDGEVGTASSGGSSPEDAVQNATAQYCARFFECGCGTLDGAWYSSVEQCIALEEPQTLGIVQSGRDAGLTFDEECFEARIGRYLSLGCDADWNNAGSRIVCNVHHGSLAPGAACTQHESAQGDDCARGLFCWSGTCVELETEYAIGEACYLQHPYCEYGGICTDLDNDGTRVCEALPSTGQPCLGPRCAPGLVCDEQSICVAAPGVGDPCGPPSAECAPCLECNQTLDPPACGEGLRGPDEPCASDRDCAAGTWCRDAAKCSSDPVVCWSGTDSVPISVSEYATCR